MRGSCGKKGVWCGMPLFVLEYFESRLYTSSSEKTQQQGPKSIELRKLE